MRRRQKSDKKKKKEKVKARRKRNVIILSSDDEDEEFNINDPEPKTTYKIDINNLNPGTGSFGIHEGYEKKK